MMTSASPELVRALFDHSPLPQLVFDPETLAFIDVNEAALRHYGYTRAEFLARSVLDLRPREDVERARAAARRPVAEADAWRGVWRHLRKDGSEMWVDLVVADLALGRRKARLVTARDVTEERRAVEALRLNEQRFHGIVDSGAEALVLQDAEGRPVWASAAASNVFRCAPERLVGRQGLDLVHPDDRAAVGAARAAAEARPFERIRSVARYAVDGEPWRWLETVRVNRLDDPAVGAVVLHVRDVTEQREAEEALRRSEESFRAAIESAPDLVMVVRGGRLVYVNAAVLAALRHPREALVGQEVMAFVHPDDRDRAVAALARALTRRERRAEELRVARGDGGYAALEFCAVDVLFDGAPAVLAFGRDLTARRLLEARLAAADRMGSLGELAAGIVHEINNPVSYALANVAYAADAMEPLLAAAAPDDARELAGALRDARQGLERVRDIVRDLKTFSRSDEEAFRAVDLHDVLDAACSMSRNEVKHRARLVRRYGRGQWVRGDEGKLAQVFVNLLVNAAQAIPDGRADENVVSVEIIPWPGAWIAVEVSDTGQGVTAEHMPRLFDPFFTTKPKGVGTGLGLSIADSIVRAHGGRLEVETSLGQGSCFRVLLREGPPPVPAACAEAAGPAPGRPLRVLVVDDEPRVCDALHRLLGRGHALQSVTSGRAALELLRDGARFDAILCDVMMPELNGAQLLQAVAEAFPEQADRFVFMTGGVFSAEAAHLLAEARRPVLRKPFDREALLVCLRACDGEAAGAAPA